MASFENIRHGPSNDFELLQDYAATTWHAYRTHILLAALAMLLSAYVYLLLTEEREFGLSLAAREGKKGGYDEKNQVLREPETGIDEKITTDAKQAREGPKRIRGERPKEEGDRRNGSQPFETGEWTLQPIIFFSSLTGSTERIAQKLAEDLRGLLSVPPNVEESEVNGEVAARVVVPEVLDLAEIDYDEYFLNAPTMSSPRSSIPFYLFLVPSYNVDTINDTFLSHLQETHHDFRIDKAPLAAAGVAGYTVFGLGDREEWATEEEGFCFQAREIDRWMARLTGRRRAFPLGMSDAKVDLEERLRQWREGVVEVLRSVAKTGGLGEGIPGSGYADESEDEYISDREEMIDEEENVKEVASTENGKPRDKVGKKGPGANLEDVEDLGKMINSSQQKEKSLTNSQRSSKAGAPIAVDFTTYGKKGSTRKPPAAQVVKEMVPKNSPTHSALTKQGYSIIGSHSGVKICRWTKSAMRGRGSCYKYSFYGIASHQCMETTPSLSCSNKCVFCWRHGTNPVGTTWRWVVDPPDLIFNGVKAAHYQKIKMMRGVPGVRAERFAEGMQIRHCALSLVGEPIFYPHINEFLSMLHAEHISSFLVCNAQHPDQLQALKAVTQLYVSIDASNRESLRRIDRPLHRDFWERFQRCLDILYEKRRKHRTVFRLTLVKGFNVEEEAEGYAGLVERAQPCFVEIKGVTYCGTTNSSKSTATGGGLTMANVPFYEEVTEFVQLLDARLRERGLDYGIAAEHAHSCCVLLASGRFRSRETGRWHTRIDYKRFFELLEERGADGEWDAEDYMGEETPEWATWGNGGFDPRDERVDRKGRKIEV